ncbi:hypothetical protein OAV62_00460 [bacterium]|nr:hypothetical protein [bacterium]
MKPLNLAILGAVSAVLTGCPTHGSGSAEITGFGTSLSVIGITGKVVSGILKIEADGVLSGPVSFEQHPATTGGIIYTADWVVDLNTNTITATNVACTDIGTTYPLCGSDDNTPTVDDGWIAGVVAITTDWEGTGDEAYTIFFDQQIGDSELLHVFTIVENQEETEAGLPIDPDVGKADNLYTASSFGGTGTYDLAVGAQGTANVDFTIDTDAMTITLDGFLTTIGSPDVPFTFASNEFVFSRAIYDIGAAYVTDDGDITLGHVPAVGSQIGNDPRTYAASLVSGTAVCTQGNGADCPQYLPDTISGLSYINGKLSVSFLSESGSSGWMIKN